jgi:precorrin-2 dehydrogenase/sirohydrochlorin ferrochelatase
MKEYFPIALNLTGKKVLLVGAGTVALEKLEKLLMTGCNIICIAPKISKKVAQLAQNSNNHVLFMKRKVCKEDLLGKALCITATGNHEVNLLVARWADEARVLFNTADKPELCQFFMMSTFRRGPLKISISTGGAYPGLSKALRKLLEVILPIETEGLLYQLAALRQRYQKEEASTTTRIERLNKVAERFAEELRPGQPKVTVNSKDEEVTFYG